MREGEVLRLRSLTLSNKQQAQARLEQLEEARRRAQGRAVALGRTPREQRDIRQQIANMTAEIDRLERIVRGFGGRPDPEARRIRGEQRLAEIAENQRRRREEGSPSITRSRPAARRRRGAASAPEPVQFARRIAPRESPDPNVIAEEDIL